MESKFKGRFTAKNTGHVKHKRMLVKKGWSRRAAAPHLGVHYTHLDLVLNGHRASKALLRRIEELPAREEVAK